MGVHIAGQRHSTQPPADRDLGEAVHAALRAHYDVRLRTVRVVVQNEQVFLGGEVPTYHAKQLAQHSAMSVPGVHRVHNELVVDHGGARP